MATPTCTTGDDIPGDILAEILVKLPVKLLLLCKSVSKPWLSLISNHKFINAHLKHTITTPGADETFLAYNTFDHSMSLFDLDSLKPGARPGFPYSRGDFPFDPYVRLISSCNGVVCVCVSNCPRPREISFDYYWYIENDNELMNPYTYLWNPATNKSKLIPLHNVRGDILEVAIGFGFDPIGNDFKVVRIVWAWDKTWSTEAEVYSVNTNLWRKVEHTSDSEFHRDFHFCVNGFLFCTGLECMVVFDLNKEVFNYSIQLPATARLSSIIDLNDSVAFTTFKGNECSNTINIWTLDDKSCLRDGGVEASWTMMLSIDVDIFKVCPTLVFGYLKRGDLLLYSEDSEDSEDGVWFLYNIHKEEARSLPVSLGKNPPVKYNESLVSITGCQQVNWISPKDDCQKSSTDF